MKLPMICYLYDEETGVYLNRSTEAKADPKQRGAFDIPINATLDPPPSVPDPERQIAVFDGDEWHIRRKAGLADEGTEKKGLTKKVKLTPEQERNRG